MFNARLILVASAMILAPACARTGISHQQLMDTQGAITSAESLEADDNPDAKLHLQFARDQLHAAEEMISERDDEAAQRMLDRAGADADLALLLARTEKLREESRAARLEVKSLQPDRTASRPARRPIRE